MKNQSKICFYFPVFKTLQVQVYGNEINNKYYTKGHLLIDNSIYWKSA